MVIHLTIDKSLVKEARVVGDHPTDLAAVIAALQEYIMRLQAASNYQPIWHD